MGTMGNDGTQDSSGEALRRTNGDDEEKDAGRFFGRSPQNDIAGGLQIPLWMGTTGGAMRTSPPTTEKRTNRNAIGR